MPPVFARENCGVCHGTGWEILSFDGPRRARRCYCGTLNRLVNIKERIRIPTRYEQCTLDNYFPLSLSQARALSIARRFARRYPFVESDLFFLGKPGVGKTHLAVGIARQLLNRFFDSMLFVDFSSLVARLSELPSASGLDVERLVHVDLLVLDDLGAGAVSTASLCQVITAMQERHSQKRTTIFTGDPARCRDLLERHLTSSPAVPDCWRDLKVIAIAGADFRRKRSTAFESIQGWGE